jgi:hypothetical protein
MLETICIIFQSGVFFTKFRISDHSLEIEKGRYNKTTCERFSVKSAPSQIGLKKKVKSAPKNKNKKRINK